MPVVSTSAKALILAAAILASALAFVKYKFDEPSDKSSVVFAESLVSNAVLSNNVGLPVKSA